MAKLVLIVHPDSEMRDTIQDELNDLQVEGDGYHLILWRAQNRAEAEEYAESKSIDLVVTALEIAADAKSSIGAGKQERLGIKLVRSLQTKTPGIKAIVITAHVDDELADFTRSESVDWAEEGPAFGSNLQSAMKRLLGPDRPRQVVLSISLSRGACSYQFQYEGGVPRTALPLDIDVDALEKLVRKTRWLHVKDPSWEVELDEIGDDLAGALFDTTPRNQQFHNAFYEWKGAVRGLANMRVRFTVDDTLQPLAVEALKEAGTKEYWMLETPIFRGQERGGGPGQARPGLFTDEATSKGPLNFLIIAADVPPDAKATVGERIISLLPLENLKGEVSDIARLLSTLKNKQGRRIGKVRVVGSANILADGSPLNELKDSVHVDVNSDGSLKVLVRDALQARNWHVVHYVGHSRYDPDEHVGRVFFPCLGKTNKVEPVTIGEFALWLGQADTRLVFLSSCTSAGQDFIYRLAKERVPAVMGFLWEVRDASAREYAKRFYECLLESSRISLEDACLATKKQMHAKDPKDPIWASSVLVMQVSI